MILLLVGTAVAETGNPVFHWGEAFGAAGSWAGFLGGVLGFILLGWFTLGPWITWPKKRRDGGDPPSSGAGGL